ncbi:MAG TPA: hypothetical protein VK937_14775 [Candidatus Limnocylindria bacterium]|jgi:hypothetical protein|nr:hypothetical protein [Candidatus Limnocylindria bacterium]
MIAGAARDYVYDLSGHVLAEMTGSGWSVGYAYLRDLLLAQ